MAHHPVIRRALGLFAASYALMWAAISMTAGPGPSALVALTGDPGHAGLFFAVFSLATAVGAGVGGRLMDRMGRRPVLMAAHILSAAGYATVGVAVARASLVLFLVGLVALASGIGAAYLTRLAAAELFPPAQRGQGMAWALMGAAGGALLGPALLVTTGGTGLDGVWFVAAPLPLLAAIAVAFAPESTRIAQDLPRYHGALAHVPIQVAATPAGPLTWAAGFSSLALAQAAMVGVMGIAGAWLGREGQGVRVMAAVMALHFVGMFALAPWVGRIADRTGRRRTILGGLFVLGGGGIVIALIPGVLPFALGLFLVGVGWCFAYLGATALLTDATVLARRASVLGRADLVSSFAGALAAAAAGVWFATRGLVGLGLAAAAILIVPVVVVALLHEPTAPTDGDAPAVG